MQISDGILSDVPYMPSRNRGGAITPKFLVMHYTAGFSDASAISWLRNPGSRASAHIVVGSDGDITQLVPFNIKAWHAGPSRFDGVSGLNSHSIGFEIANVGWLKKVGARRYEDWAGNRYTEGEGWLADRDLIEQPHPRVGSGMLYWPTYPEEQLAAVERVTRAVLAEYPTIRAIVSHEEIDTRGWKTDPGPAFPMQRFQRLLDDRSDGEADPPTDEITRLGKALTAIISAAQGELQRDPASEKHRRWRLAEVSQIATDALKGN